VVVCWLSVLVMQELVGVCSGEDFTLTDAGLVVDIDVLKTKANNYTVQKGINLNSLSCKYNMYCEQSRIIQILLYKFSCSFD